MTTQGVSLTLNLADSSKSSRIIFGSLFLAHRIKVEIAERIARKMANAYPPISFIKNSHFIPFDTGFKPCVVVAHHYVEQNGQSCKLGSSVEFCLKFNSDYLNDGYVGFNIPEIKCNAADLGDIIVKPYDADVLTANADTPTNFGQGRLALAGELSKVNVADGFSYVFNGVNPVNTQVVYNGLTYDINVSPGAGVAGDISYLYTDAHGTFVAGPDGTAVQPTLNGFGAGGQAAKVQRTNYVRAADLLGIKIAEMVEFSADNSLIADYSSYDVVNFREKFLSEGISRNAYDRLIGHDVPQNLTALQTTLTSTNVPGLSADRAFVNSFQEHTSFSSGLQVPKPVIAAHKVWHPLMFWFNCKRKDALPIMCTPDADLVFKVNTAPLDSLYFPVAGDTYIQEHVVLHGADNTNVATPDVVVQRRIPYLVPESKIITNCCEICTTLTTCQIYLDDIVHDILINRIGFHLIRIIRRAKNTLTSGDACVEVNGIKWPVEYFFVRDIPLENKALVAPYHVATDWYKCGNQTREIDQGQWVSQFEKTLVGGVTTYTRVLTQLKHREIVSASPAITHFGVSIYDTKFFDKVTREFYANYIPYAYSNGYIISDKEKVQALMINFAQIPGYSNPNGIFNISKTRNLNYELVTETGSSGKVEAHTSAHCINFILISDGSMAVRYQ